MIGGSRIFFVATSFVRIRARTRIGARRICNGKELYNGESIARGSSLVLVVGNGNRPVRKESVIDEDYFE